MRTDSKPDQSTGWESMEKDGKDQLDDGTATTMSSTATYHTTHEGGDSKSLSLTVIEALSDAQGVSPTEMEQPLYNVIDPDALDNLFSNARDDVDGRIVFSISGYEVTVTASGDVFVRESP